MSNKRFTFRPVPLKTHHLCEILDNDKRLGIARHSDGGNIVDSLNVMNDTIVTYAKENHKLTEKLNEQQVTIEWLQEEIKRLWKMLSKLQWRFEQEVGIEKAREHYQEIDEEMKV